MPKKKPSLRYRVPADGRLPANGKILVEQERERIAQAQAAPWIAAITDLVETICLLQGTIEGHFQHATVPRADSLYIESDLEDRVRNAQRLAGLKNGANDEWHIAYRPDREIDTMNPNDRRSKMHGRY